MNDIERQKLDSDTMLDANATPSPDLGFLRGGSEAARLILGRDWWDHPLGEPHRWPEGLKSTLSLVLNSPESMILCWGRDELTFFFNDAYAPLLGPRAAWAMGAPFVEVWSDAWEQARPIVEDAFAGRSPHYVDLPWKLETDRGERDTWWTFSYSRVLNAAGEVVGLFIFTNETTGRVLADRSAEESAQRLATEIERQRLSLQQMPGFVALLSGPDHRFDYVNDAYAALSSPRAYVDRPVCEVFPELEGQPFFDMLDRVFSTGVPFAGRAVPITLEGDQSERYLDFSYQPIRNDAGEVTGVFVGGYEVTETVRAQRRREALDVLEARIHDVADPAELSFALSELLGQTLNACRVGYGTVDPVEQTISIERDWAQSGCRTLAGVNSFNDYGSIFEDLSRGIPVVVTDVDVDPRTSEAAPSFHAIGNRAFIDVVVLENGAPAAQVYVHSPEPRAWTSEEVALVQDMAERTHTAIARREAERSLRSYAATLEERVVERTRELEEAHERLRQSQKMEAVGQLTGGVAHDFNNLLTVIRGSVDLLRRPGITEERRGRYIDAIGDTAERAAKLTGQLLAFARRQTLNPETFDVGERVTAVADMLQSVTGNLVLIDTQISNDSCFTRADANQFETALINMAVNAKDAMGGEGRLTIAVASTRKNTKSLDGNAPATFVSISLTDTGSGIALADRERIFEPFFTTKEVGKGTGLGLSQVFGFAKQSGGDVQVDSELGRGTTITLLLPETAPSAVTSPEADEPIPAQDGGGLCVLVVEDNADVGRFSTQVLTDLGYRSHWVASAEEALTCLGDEGADFDIVFSDVVMPGMGGIALARRLGETMPDMPVLLASGYSEVLAEQGTGGLTLLPKPYSAGQLSNMLRRIAARAPVREQSVD